jgi:diguanylate cyclase (GGDEF)-like protein/PAS domain S-box-containing protein
MKSVQTKSKAKPEAGNPPLAAEAAELKKLFENSSVCFFTKDVYGRYTYANRKFKEVIGIASGSISGRCDHDFLNEALANKLSIEDHNTLISGLPVESEERRIDKSSGEVRFYRTIKQAIRNTEGVITGLFGLETDITACKLNEKMLRELVNEQLLQNKTYTLINQQTPLSLLLDDLVRQVESLRPGMICSIMLISDDGKHLRHGASPSLPEDYKRAMDEISINDGLFGSGAYAGELYIVEDIQQHPFGSTFFKLTELTSLQSCWSWSFTNKFGKILGIFIIYHRQKSRPSENDLNLIKRYVNLTQIAIESNLAQHELQLAAAIFESKEGIYVTDANHVITRVNLAFTRITGYRSEEMTGKIPSTLNSGRQSSSFYTKLWSEIEKKGRWEGEIWNRRKNGEVYPEQLLMRAVKNQAGKICNYVASIADITRNKASEEQINNLAFLDPLTNLPNRRLLQDRIQHAFSASVSSNNKGALLFIDLDNFKTLNETLGHEFGDMLLQQVAQLLLLCVHEGDTVARIGGDEFVVILEDLAKETDHAAAQVEAVGGKMLTTLARTYRLSTHDYYGTISIGATIFSGHEHTADEIFKQADIAMYQAKEAGRNMLRFYDADMQANITKQVQMESDLRNALDSGEQFLIFYQAQVDSAGHLTGAEALVRWQHPKIGMISPADFIPLAETSGLIIPIGLEVLTTACGQLARWMNRPETAHLTLAVNISAKQFMQPDFTDEVLALLDHFGINPEKLKLEMTESVVLHNVDDIITKMTALKKWGIKFSMDDFGTGYSSLQYLKRLPLDQLKIDQSFVRNLVNDSSDKAIVRTIIAMAESLELDIIAEGVETNQHRQILIDIGCTNFQGFLFGKPVPIEQFEAIFSLC